jgi:hypothetical protein
MSVLAVKLLTVGSAYLREGLTKKEGLARTLTKAIDAKARTALIFNISISYLL